MWVYKDLQVSRPLKTTNGALIYFKYDKMIVVYIIIIAAIHTNYNTNMFFNCSFRKNY